MDHLNIDKQAVPGDWVPWRHHDGNSSSFIVQNRPFLHESGNPDAPAITRETSDAYSRNSERTWSMFLSDANCTSGCVAAQITEWMIIPKILNSATPCR